MSADSKPAPEDGEGERAAPLEAEGDQQSAAAWRTGQTVTLVAPVKDYRAGAKGKVEGQANGAVQVRMEADDVLEFCDPAHLAAA